MPVTNSNLWAATLVILLSFGRDDGAVIAGACLVIAVGRAMWAKRRAAQ